MAYGPKPVPITLGIGERAALEAQSENAAHRSTRAMAKQAGMS